MDALEQFMVLLGWKLEGEADRKRFEAGLDQTAAKVEAFTRRVTKGFADFGDSLVAKMRGPTLALGAASAAAGVALGKGVISLSSDWEKYSATLETVEGSADKAKASLDWAANFAKTTPYDLANVTQALIRLKASGLDPMDGTLAAVGDAASAMGTDLMSGVEAIADAATGEYERLKAYGITASVEGKKVTFAWRRNGEQFTKTLDKNGAAIAKFVKENFEGRFGGAMLRQSKTFGGMMSNLGDAWDDFQRRIGRGGFFEAVKNRLGDLLDFIGDLDASGQLDRFSKTLSYGFERAVKGVVVLAKNFAADIRTIGDLFANVDWDGKLKPFMTLMGLLALQMFPVTGLLAGAALALNDFLTYLRGGDSYIGDFIKALSEFLGADPAKVASVLGDIAQAAGWFAAAAVGLSLFASALRSLSGALFVLKGMQWAVGFLGALAGISWTGAAAGAATAAGAGAGAAGAGAAGTAGGLAVNPAATVAAGSAALGAASMGVVGAMDPAQRRGLYDTPMIGAMSGDFALGAALYDQAQANAEAQAAGETFSGRIKAWFASDGVQALVGGMRQALDIATNRVNGAFETTAGFSSDQNNVVMQVAFDRFAANMQRMQAPNMPMTFAPVDNRQFPITVHAPVTQNITTPTAAPAAAAQGIGQAIGQAAVQARPSIAATGGGT